MSCVDGAASWRPVSGGDHDVPPARLTGFRTAVALHEGDAEPRKAVWSSHEPVTLFGAEVERTGRPEIESTFDWVASRFEGCRSFDYDVVAADASGNLGYLVAYERVTATVGGAEVS